jgi:hypothetical protein
MINLGYGLAMMHQTNNLELKNYVEDLPIVMNLIDLRKCLKKVGALIMN